MSGVPIVRRPEFPFDTVSRWWFQGSPFVTHLANGMNFVFPAGERFFVRSVVHYRDRVDPELRRRIDGFAGQEAWHGRSHAAAFAAVEAHGLEVRSWIAWYERVGYEVIEPRVSPAIRLATTAALEHFTAIFGELALDTEMLDGADPAMRDLLSWHAAEEIEHRAVAFDVLQQVDRRWLTRAIGFVMATLTLGFFWASATRHLLRQERRAPRSARVAGGRREVARYWRRHGGRALRRAFAWFHPGFHPDEVPIDALATRYLAAMAQGLRA
jgi:predicted metal-dependent hydrolase